MYGAIIRGEERNWVRPAAPPKRRQTDCLSAAGRRYLKEQLAEAGSSSGKDGSDDNQTRMNRMIGLVPSQGSIRHGGAANNENEFAIL
jgi:hypothetical protein